MRRIILGVLSVVALSTSSAALTEETDEKLKDIRAYLRISDHLSTSGQIPYEHIKEVRAAGFDVIVNLAPANKERNALEGFLATEAGMTYIQIPVSWKEPSLRDLSLFFDFMDANTDRKVYVHCFANMRASVFVYLYRTLRLGEAEESARQDLIAIWDPVSQEQWTRFIKEAQTKWKQE